MCFLLPQCSHVSIIALIVVVRAPFAGSFLCPTNTHFTQVALASWQTALPEDLRVHCDHRYTTANQKT